MRKLNKKGFTIVELVIVIAVVAILAAVLIPTFVSVTKKANESADIQACRQMNTYLAINEVTEGKTIDDVYSLLSENGMTAKNYHPLYSGRFFFWDSKINRVIYTDENYNVLFPENSGADRANGWASLSGKIKEEQVTVAADGNAEISNGEQLYWLANNKKADIKTIEFTNDIDLMGADIGLTFNPGENVTIKGKEGGTKITGLVQNKAKLTGLKGNTTKNYASGFVALIDGATVTIENIHIENAVVGDLESGGVGALVGRIQKENKKPDPKSAVVTIKNCSVTNSIVKGMNKVGGLVGSLNGTLTIENCNLNQVTVNCSEGEASKVIGAAYNAPTITVDREFSGWVTDVNVSLVKGTVEREIKNGTVTFIKPNESVETTYEDCTCLVRYTKEGVVNSVDELERYRMFNGDAYVSFIAEGSAMKLSIGGEEKFSSHNYGAQAKTVKVGGEKVFCTILEIYK